MPHITLEYSGNLDASVAMADLCETVRQAALSAGIFEVGAVRVRAVRCDAYAITDCDARNGFIDGSLRMGEGRPAETRRMLGETIFAAMSDFLAPQLAGEYFALSFEVREIQSAMSFKTNTMHTRLRAQAV